MNNRIKELTQQASSWVEVDCDHGTDSEYQLDTKKFAELIVLETLAQVNQNMELTWIDGEAKIKQHFGIEE